MKQATKQQQAKWDKANLAAARAILEHPHRHPEFMHQWARRCLNRFGEERTGQRALKFTSPGETDYEQRI